MRTPGTTRACTGTIGTGIPGIMTLGTGDVRAITGAGTTTLGTTIIIPATALAGTRTAGTVAATDNMSTAA